MASSLLCKRAAASSIRSLFPSFYTPLFHHNSSILTSTPSPVTSLINKHSTSTFTTTTTAKMGSEAFLKAVAARRTIYALKKESTISDAKIQEIITQALLNVPSSFNSQSTRVVLLVKGEHDKLWDITKDVLKGIVPAEQYPQTEQRLNGFQAGYGTVLFFVSRKAVKVMQEKFALYADRFPTWATHSDGMHQYAVWCALEAEGLGANLQHYNPLIDAKVQAEWNVDPDWELSAELVFGTPAGEAGAKEAEPIETRFKTYGV